MPNGRRRPCRRAGAWASIRGFIPCPGSRRRPGRWNASGRISSPCGTIRSTSCGGTSRPRRRSEEHTSELQSLMRISYAVFCLKKKKTDEKDKTNTTGVVKEIDRQRRTENISKQEEASV